MVIQGFKSIAHAEIVLDGLNVIIGANGAGKSNLLGLFRLLEQILSGRLQVQVASQPDRLLHHGRKVTPVLSLACHFDRHRYDCSLTAQQETLIFAQEQVYCQGRPLLGKGEGGHAESRVVESASLSPDPLQEALFLRAWQSTVYHFNDTSDSAPLKRLCALEDNRALRGDAANLAPFLYWLQEKHPLPFRHIEEHVRLVAPFFDCFLLAPSRLQEDKIQLEWRQQGSDAHFDAYALSDGTLRFICLATLLLQPNPPPILLLDEPELGLHPSAIHLLAEMLEAASRRTQVLCTTQSVTLLDHFAPEAVVVVENDGRQTTFRRLEAEPLKAWLAEFSLGQLWEKNLLGGRP
ncbi:MAG: AAA family ATPase [Magnetococcus sp. YQC-3]